MQPQPQFQPLSSTERKHNLSRLASERFDVLVIGGGVTGAGVALDAAARGYNVALVEKMDFASGTSSKSTKLVHGGIRYLSNLDFALVREALIERGLLLQNAPYLVHRIPFVLPHYKGDRHPIGMPFSIPGGIGLSLLINSGLLLYDVMAGRLNVGRHRHLRPKTILELAPALAQEGLKDGYMYYDAQTNDVRLTVAIIRTAAQYGATIANYAEVTSFITEHNKLTGVLLHDRLGNQELTIHARHIVNATGIFAEQVAALTGTDPLVQIEPSKGVHLVLSREDVRLGEAAIVLPETEDQRILFIVPWESRAIFGTTDTGSGDLDHPTATPEDIAYLLKYLNRYLSVKLTTEQIVSTYVGYRPLVRSRKSQQTTARLSRTHAVLEDPNGLVSIVGGKLTTYRRMAQDTVDTLRKRDGAPLRHPTETLLLHGSVGWPTAELTLQSRGTALGLSSQTITHLGKSFGSEALSILELIEHDASLAAPLIDDLPYIRAEILYACRQEMAMTPYDILARRTSITLEDRQRGLGIVEEVAAMMATELGWTPDVQEKMVEAYHAVIEGQMAAEHLAPPREATTFPTV